MGNILEHYHSFYTICKRLALFLHAAIWEKLFTLPWKKICSMLSSSLVLSHSSRSLFKTPSLELKFYNKYISIYLNKCFSLLLITIMFLILQKIIYQHVFKQISLPKLSLLLIIRCKEIMSNTIIYIKRL